MVLCRKKWIVKCCSCSWLVELTELSDVRWSDWVRGWGTTTGIKLPLCCWMGAKAELIGSGPGVSAPGSKSRRNHLKVGFSETHLRKTLGAVRAVLAYIFHDHQNNHRFAVPSIKVLSGLKLFYHNFTRKVSPAFNNSSHDWRDHYWRPLVKFDTKSSEICPYYRIPFLQQSKQFDWLVAAIDRDTQWEWKGEGESHKSGDLITPDIVPKGARINL